MEPRLQPEEDADKLAQDVVNAWGINVTAGNAELLSTEFKALFEKVEAYRFARKIADNRREHNILTADVEEQERTTRKEFLAAHRAFHAMCECGHPKASHDDGSKQMQVDDALLPQRPAQWNIYTDEARGKTRCMVNGCICLAWRPRAADLQ
jgi:hypothetical protein